MEDNGHTFDIADFPCPDLPPGLSPPNQLSPISTAIPQTETLLTPSPESWLSTAVPNLMAHETNMQTLYQMHLLPVPFHYDL